MEFNPIIIIINFIFIRCSLQGLVIAKETAEMTQKMTSKQPYHCMLFIVLCVSCHYTSTVIVQYFLSLFVFVHIVKKLVSEG